MAEDGGIPLFPVVGFEVRFMPSNGWIFIRLPFISHAMQRPEEADPGRRYAFSPRQARQLADGILEELAKMESGKTPPGGMPKH